MRARLWPFQDKVVRSAQRRWHGFQTRSIRSRTNHSSSQSLVWHQGDVAIATLIQSMASKAITVLLSLIERAGHLAYIPKTNNCSKEQTEESFKWLLKRMATILTHQHSRSPWTSLMTLLALKLSTFSLRFKCQTQFRTHSLTTMWLEYRSILDHSSKIFHPTIPVALTTILPLTDRLSQKQVTR